MELLLNLLWLTLALPAIWMWRREPVFARGHRRFARTRPFVLLGCALMLLFPVVSATDDIQAMRQEMEESSPSRVVRSGGEKSQPGLSSAGSSPALLSSSWLVPKHEACGQVVVVAVQLLEQTCFLSHSSRAPPFCLGVWAKFVA
jgi:hypothetical protein